MDVFIEYECYVIMKTLNHLARWAGGIDSDSNDNNAFLDAIFDVTSILQLS